MELNVLRALFYKYASKLLDYPYDKDVEKMGEVISDFLGVLELIEEKGYRGLSAIAKDVSKMVEEIEDFGVDDFQAEYVSLFELGYPKPKCPPYEREYMSLEGVKDELEVLDEITAFYSKHGVFGERDARSPGG